MPLEIKHIYFTESELKKALINFSVRKKQYIKMQDIRELIVDDGENIKISLLIDKTLNFKDDRVDYSAPEIAAALLAFCMVCKIPMPKSGRKEISAKGKKVYLKISLNQEINFEKYNITDRLQNSSMS